MTAFSHTPIRPAHGFLVAFEGLDGAGKSTQASMLKSWLEEKGLPSPLLLSEPTRGVYGTRLREMAKERRDREAEMSLLLKDRAEDVDNNISPALAQGRAVIMDRYILSNVAYQGALPGGDPDSILKANGKFPWPDLTFLLEVEVSEGLERVSKRGEVEEAFENAGYLEKVKKIFDAAACEGLVRLKSQFSKDLLFGRVKDVVDQFLSSPSKTASQPWR